MTPAKILFLIKNSGKIIRKVVTIILTVLFICLILMASCESGLISVQSSTSLADAAQDEYNYWQQTSVKSSGYSCQGEKYCSYFNSSVTDWCCYFAGYCIEQADLDLTECGYSSNVHTWISNLKSLKKLKNANSYTPSAGNLIFFDYNGRNHYANGGMPTHIGIVVEVNGDTITVIAGNEYSGSTSNWSSVSYVNRYSVSTSSNSVACYGAVGDEDSASYSISLSGANTKLSSVTRNVICHNEVGVLYDDLSSSAFGSVIANDNGALSIGIYGWHGNNALSLLQTAYSINSSQVTSACKSYKSGNKILSQIKSSNSDWSSYIPATSACNCIKAVLLTSAGKTAQDKTSLEDAQSYISICQNQGLTKKRCIVYCSDILNQWGTGSFNANVYGAGSHGVLYNVTNKMTLKQIYKSKAGWGSSSQYKSRRQWTYNYLKSNY